MTPAVCLLFTVLLSVACWLPLIWMYRATERAYMKPRLVAAPEVLYEISPYPTEWIGHV